MSEHDFNFYFNLLYSVYSFPNIILPFLGGYFVAKLGARWMNVLFCCFILLGQVRRAHCGCGRSQARAHRACRR